MELECMITAVIGKARRNQVNSLDLGINGKIITLLLKTKCESGGVDSAGSSPVDKHSACGKSRNFLTG
jgi:hypothetical protein